jgi:hypothetical protein
MNVDAHVVRATESAFSGVNPDPDSNNLGLCPGLGRQTALSVDGTSDRSKRRLEGHEEPIAFVLDDVPTVFGAGVLDDLVVALEQGTELITELLEDSGGAFDVREEETNRAEREGS